MDVCSRLGPYHGAAAVSVRRPLYSISTVSLNFRKKSSLPHRWLPAKSTAVISASSHPSFDLSPPLIDFDELDVQGDIQPSGARDSSDSAIGSFADDDVAIDAAYSGVVVADLTNFGRIRVSGEDRFQFLHNQSTANFQVLSEGQGCDTVFVSPTARTIDVAHAWVMKNAIMLIISPTTRKIIADMLSRYIFFADKVEINDITEKTCLFTLIGPQSVQVMEALKLDVIGKPYGSHYHYAVNGAPITVGVGSLLKEEGFSLMTSPESAESIWRTLVRLGAVPMGPTAWERLRILNGRPAPDKELTKDYNVLEAGLWRTISLDKGCYKGQETISRLITYDGVKQSLWALSLAGPVEPGSSITVNGEKMGILTSYGLGREGEHVGLGYVKRKATPSAGLEISVGEVQGTLIQAPFLTYSLGK